VRRRLIAKDSDTSTIVILHGDSRDCGWTVDATEEGIPRLVVDMVVVLPLQTYAALRAKGGGGRTSEYVVTHLTESRDIQRIESELGYHQKD
jgi:hypothetical protein